MGSIPFDSEQTVFKRVFEALPGRVATVPDGECNSRSTFVLWQRFAFPIEMQSPIFAGIEPAGVAYPKDLDHMPPTRHDEVAVSSYQTFVKSRTDGVIPSGVRFQVSLPGTLNVVLAHVKPEYQEQAFKAYEKQYLQDAARIADKIPAADLAVQIDSSVETAFLEYERGNQSNQSDGFIRPFFSNVRENTIASLVRLAKVFVDPDIKFGFHLCYGDIEHQHFMQPKDLDLCAGMANELVRELKPFRRVDWIHMTVPKDRMDDSYFAPLKHLDIGDAKLFLGLVHPHDEPGTSQRITAAQTAYKRPFGVATECGLGRVPLDDIDNIFEISRNVSDPVF